MEKAGQRLAGGQGASESPRSADRAQSPGFQASPGLLQPHLQPPFCAPAPRPAFWEAQPGSEGFQRDSRDAESKDPGARGKQGCRAVGDTGSPGEGWPAEDAAGARPERGWELGSGRGLG